MIRLVVAFAFVASHIIYALKFVGRAANNWRGSVADRRETKRPDRGNPL
jgi:hypothetical protein